MYTLLTLLLVLGLIVSFEQLQRWQRIGFGSGLILWAFNSLVGSVVVGMIAVLIILSCSYQRILALFPTKHA